MKTEFKLLQTRMLCGVTLVVLGLYLVPVTTAAANFTDANWSSMGGFPGANGPVNAAVVDGAGNLYIGGDFTVAGDVIANGIAKWDRVNWSALGSGIGSPDSFDHVSALAMSGEDLYVGGTFSTAGGIAALNVAKWNGSSWSALGSVDGDYPVLNALAVLGGDVYAGGKFIMAGGISATNIARWNGKNWSALGPGLSGSNGGYIYEVSALAVSGGDLYVGGNFTTAGGIVADGIAKWNGSNWSALGSGLHPKVVYALAVSGSDLYAGGLFPTIAKWNGSNWSMLGSGMETGNHYRAPVVALAVSGKDVYAGGYFTTADGVPANSIARWNGSSWSPLGSGMDGSVGALAVSGSDLYAGGEFKTAGGKVSPFIARAYLPALPTLSVNRSGSDVKVSWPSVYTSDFTLEQTAALAASSNWLPNITRITDDGTNNSVSLPATNRAQLFRLRR